MSEPKKTKATFMHCVPQQDGKIISKTSANDDLVRPYYLDQQNLIALQVYTAFLKTQKYCRKQPWAGQKMNPFIRYTNRPGKTIPIRLLQFLVLINDGWQSWWICRSFEDIITGFSIYYVSSTFSPNMPLWSP